MHIYTYIQHTTYTCRSAERTLLGLFEEPEPEFAHSLPQPDSGLGVGVVLQVIFQAVRRLLQDIYNLYLISCIHVYLTYSLIIHPIKYFMFNFLLVYFIYVPPGTRRGAYSSFWPKP